jgi:hypothetical protein
MSSMPDGMTYIVQRKDRFYVVAYDGLDPLTGRERRCWHPVADQRDAEKLAVRLQAERAGSAPVRGGSLRLADFLRSTWLPHKRRQVRSTTPPTGTPGSSTGTSSRPSATCHCDACAPTTSMTSTNSSRQRAGDTVTG